MISYIKKTCMKNSLNRANEARIFFFLNVDHTGYCTRFETGERISQEARFSVRF
jgi:hypothetical protein